MPYMLYRGYRIQVQWEAEHRYTVHLFPHDQANATGSRSLQPGKEHTSQLNNPDGSDRSFRSVTDAMTAAQQPVDGLRNATFTGSPR